MRAGWRAVAANSLNYKSTVTAVMRTGPKKKIDSLLKPLGFFPDHKLQDLPKEASPQSNAAYTISGSTLSIDGAGLFTMPLAYSISVQTN